MLFLDVDCSSLMPIIRLIKNGVLPLIYIGIPIIVIILIALDLGKAAMAGKEDEIKSAQKMAIKRAIYGVAVFLVVFLVQTVFGLLSSTGDDTVTSQSGNWLTCWNKA